ncbi:porin family protein [Winogradskyella tangerina]|uniref:porin family protein n=1 Tax=Winogradskyella tangerina TaxID=2023240 RepID=UPI000DBE6BED|nr:porin family protein [Winogradskyella tangerina]
MKTILSVVMLALTLSSIGAQEGTKTEESKFDFGIRAGYNTYFLNTSGQNPTGSGYYGGIFLESELTKKWALQIEANYNYSGSSTLQLPVLLKYKISKKFELFAGPQLDFSFEQQNLNEESRNKRWGMSFLIGAQYNINSHWFIDARYTHGLTNQFPVFQGFGVNPIYEKRHAFNFGIGYKF